MFFISAGEHSRLNRFCATSIIFQMIARASSIFLKRLAASVRSLRPSDHACEELAFGAFSCNAFRKSRMRTRLRVFDLR